LKFNEYSRIWFLVVSRPLEIEQQRLIQNRENDHVNRNERIDPREIRKAELKAKGPQEKPNFLVFFSFENDKR